MTTTDKLYQQFLENLRLQIDVKYVSVSAFANHLGICRFNLSKVFNFHQELSVGLFEKIYNALYYPEVKMCSGANPKITMRELMKVNWYSVVNAYNEVIHS